MQSREGQFDTSVTRP
nr:unnamed protein product [Callosobruchus chinensis]CAH7754150.1 unnamed protein product [Callosobruchus chinensis]CAH7767113.1 unnamed protein product [Callosobruchus chinensis]